MATLKEPYIRITTIDYSQLSPLVDSTLNIAMVVDTPTGKVGKQLVTSLDNFRKNYLLGDINETDDPTILSAAKILQFSPIWITRAISNKVFGGISNNAKNVYTDSEFNVFYGKNFFDLTEKEYNPFISVSLLRGTVTVMFYANGEMTETDTSDMKYIRLFGTRTNVKTDEFFINFNNEINKLTTTLPINYQFYKLSKVEKLSNYIGFTTLIGTSVVGNSTAFFSFQKNNLKFSSKNLTTSVTTSAFESIPVSTQSELYLNGVSYFFYNEGEIVNKQFFGSQNSFNIYQGNLSTRLTSIDMPLFLSYVWDKVYSSSYFLPYQHGNNQSISLTLGDTGVYTFEVINGTNNLTEGVVGSTQGKELSINNSISPTKSIGLKIIKKSLNQTSSYAFIYIGKLTDLIPASAEQPVVSFQIPDGETVTENKFLVRCFEWLNLKTYFDSSSTEDGNFLGYDVNLKGLSAFIEDGFILNLVFSYDEGNITYISSKSEGSFDYSVVNNTNKQLFSSTVFEENLLNSYRTDIPNVEISVNQLTSAVTQVTASDDSLNMSNNLLSNVWIDLDEYEILVDGTKSYIAKYAFYNGTYYNKNDIDRVKIKISKSEITYPEWIAKFRSALNDIYPTTNDFGGVSIYNYDGTSFFEAKAKKNIFVSAEDSSDVKYDVLNIRNYNMTGYISTENFAIISRFPNKTKICNFQLERDLNNSELFKLSLSRKMEEPIDYTISFVEGIMDEFGIDAYYTKVNAMDENYYLIKFDNNLLINNVVSPTFGTEIPVVKPDPSDFVSALKRFEDFDGTYYSFIFDGGYVSPVLSSAINNIAIKLYAQGLITFPDVKNVKQVVNYRKTIGIDSWHSRFAHPYIVDNTLGSFSLGLSPQIFYLERLFYNNGAGKRYAPVFYFNNGTIQGMPKYDYSNLEDRETLLGNQINVAYFDKGRGTSIFLLDLTTQKQRTLLSTGNNTRMVNDISHIADNFLKDFIGELLTTETMIIVEKGLYNLIWSSLSIGQKYQPNSIQVVCNNSNNTETTKEGNQLIVDIGIKFENEIRYLQVYNRVLKISQDLNQILGF